ncbi:hypothetical protein Dda_0314 [Drechslerella dactyloides]|uniref:VOC domain-containing protein n=1 Tax=Drechslerella dactyloides TaxID=74499 RepID=A0AAD6NMZ2_DREDA|nr:hypothetical protein Dda_0314 [Drechslerella dactyloides]
MGINHFCIRVNSSKWEETKKFYTAALAPLNYKVLMSFQNDMVLGFGDEHPDFWMTCISNGPTDDGIHFALDAKSRTAVQEFHAVGCKNGGTCNGPAGPRPMYGEKYYAAFVHDPSGNNVEVVTFAPE